MNSKSTVVFAAAILGLLAVGAEAGTQVFKCTKDGQIVLTDKPCSPTESGNSNGNATVTHVLSSTTPSPIGKWSGQMQYHGTEMGQAMLGAQSVALLTVDFSADGKITGSSPENGCTLLRVWSQGPTQTLIWMDVTFAGCRFPGMNDRFQGSFILSRPDSSGQVQLTDIKMPLSGQVGRAYDIKGTLRCLD